MHADTPAQYRDNRALCFIALAHRLGLLRVRGVHSASRKTSVPVAGQQRLAVQFMACQARQPPAIYKAAFATRVGFVLV